MRNLDKETSNILSLLFLASLVGLVLSQSNPYLNALSRDNGFFLYTGTQILKGKLPYIDFWDSKGPIIFYINALGLFIGKGSRWGVWLLEFLFLFIESAVFFKVVQKKWGHAAALFSSIAWLYGFSRVFDGGNFTEEYSLFFGFISLAYFLSLADINLNKKLPFLLGFVLVINLMFRANNIDVPVTILLAVSFSQLSSHKYTQLKQTIFLVLVTGVVTLLSLCFYFSQKGFLIEMVEASILYNFFYSQAHHVFRLSLWQGLKYIGWPAYIALLGYIAVFAQIIKDRSIKSFSAWHFFLLLLLPFEVVMSSISGRNYVHYFISWMPAIGVLSAFAFSTFADFVFSDRLLEMLGNTKHSFLLMIPLVLFTYLHTGTFLDYQKTASHLLFERSQGIEYVNSLSEFLRENTKKDDTVLVWGAYPSINYLAKRDAPTPYLFYPAYELSPYTEKMALAFAMKIEEAPPKMIVDMSYRAPDYILSIDPEFRAAQVKREGTLLYENVPYQDMFFNFVAQHYEKIATISHFDIYSLILTEK